MSPFLHAQSTPFTLVLDAGHGGKDGGTHGGSGSTSVNEKDVALQVTKFTGEQLAKELQNTKIIYTRDSDVFVELTKRADIANQAKANLFVSIHCNAGGASAQGTETWVLGSEDHRKDANFDVVKRENSVIYLEEDYETKYAGFDPNIPEDLIAMTLIQSVHYENSIKLAAYIEQEFKADKRTSRGIRQHGFLVLVKTAMPSVLIEIGFLSNPTEKKYLESLEGQKEIAASIAEAIKKYKKEWDLKNNKEELLKKQAEQKKQEEINQQPKEIKGDNYYSIQILTSKNLYAQNSHELRGLKNVFIIKENEYYKYYYSKSIENTDVAIYLQRAKQAGFTDAYSKYIEEKKEDKKTYYTIELLHSSKKYSTNHSVFKGYKGIKRIKESSGLYSYQFGKYTTLKEAQKEIRKIQSSEFQPVVVKNSK